MKCWKMLLLALLVAGLQPALEGEPGSQHPGVVIEKIAANSSGERAGLAEGDVVLSWLRDGTAISIESPFDLLHVEMEQSPLGTVVLTGLRKGEQHQWKMPTGVWGVDSRPNLPGQLLDIYQDGQHLAEAGKLQEAALRWRNAADAAANSEGPALKAWFLLKSAGLLAGKGRPQEAGPYYEQAVASVADAKLEVRAQIFRIWGLACRQRNDLPCAQKHFRKALNEYLKLGPQSLSVATLLGDLGNVEQTLSDLAGAERDFSQALAMARTLAPDSLLVALILQGMGTVDSDQGQLHQAETRYLEALRIRERLLPESLEVAATLNNLGGVSQEEGDLDRAEEYLRHSLAIKEKLSPGSMTVANALNNLGILAYNRGDLVTSAAHHHQALEIRERLAPGSMAVVDSLGNLGQVEEARHNLDRANKYYEQALAIAEKQAPDGLIVARILKSLGNLALKHKDTSKAESYYQRTLEIELKRAPNGLDLAWTLHNLGSVYATEGLYAKAESSYRQAMAITSKLAPQSLQMAQHFLDLGELARIQGHAGDALDNYRSALALATKIAPGSSAHVESLAGLAATMQSQRQYLSAAQFYAQVLDALDNQMVRLGGTEQVRSEFRARYAQYYRDYLDLLMQQNNPDAAFQVSERLRGRSLLELLSQAHLDIRRGVDAGLLARERSVRRALDRAYNRRLQLLSQASEGPLVTASQKEIDDLLAQYHDVQEEIRHSSPAYAELTQPRPLTVAEIQLLLDPQTVLLEYSLGAKRSYLWAISRTSLSSYRLPAQTRIDSVARELYQMLSARSHAQNRKAAKVQRTAARLSEMVLGPAAARLKGKRLLIVTEGALQYIPFAALPAPESASAKPGEPLMVEHEIVSLPSASVLAALRRAAKQQKSNPKAVAVLADPVFDKEDIRVRPQIGGPAAKRSSNSNALRAPPVAWSPQSPDDANGARLSLPRLPFSRREALSILKVTAPGQAMGALDFDASVATASSSELGQYRIVHFATHGLVNSAHPELSGLVFSLVDQNGNPKDGFLALGDIYDLNLPVELVVLSACSTALGKEVDGEGLLGMTRGFMYAGAPRVIASLWNVNDVSTAELMAKLYAGVEQKHLRPAAALRAAQIAMWKQKRWRASYYWAAFLFQGEWE